MTKRSGSSISNSDSKILNAHIEQVMSLISQETKKPGSIVDAFNVTTTVLLDEMSKLTPHNPMLQQCKKTFDLLKGAADTKTLFDFQRQTAIKIFLIVEETLTKIKIINHRVKYDEEKSDSGDIAEDNQTEKSPVSTIQKAEVKIKYLMEMLDLTLSDLFFSTAKDFCEPFVSAVCELLYFCADIAYSSDLFKVTYVPNQEPGFGNDFQITKNGRISDSCLNLFKPLIAHKEKFIAFLNSREEEFLKGTSNQQQPDTTRQFVRSFLKNPLSPFFVIVSGARDRNDQNKPTGAVSQTATRNACVRSYCEAPGAGSSSLFGSFGLRR